MPILPILIKISYYPFDNFCFRFFLYLCGEVRVLTDYYALHMDGFKNIDIKNFRGIEHLKIDDFVRVNVFLGQNNSIFLVLNDARLKSLRYEKFILM